jgi:predicted nucleotide-binding protein (sugar kinase/HSP70/actin superfamily)
MSIRVGLPRGLLYFKYGRLWKRFFNAFGIDVVTSPETTDDIFADGIRHSIADICLPMKAFFGHVLTLKDHVDFLFIPRVIRVEPDAYLCPKFLGLPDMVRAAIRNLPPIIDTEFNIKEKPILSFWQEVWSKLKRPKGFSIPSDMNLNEILPEFLDFSANTSVTKLTVGIAGRHYLVMDRCLNKGIIKYMRKLGVDVIYHNPDQNYITETMKILPKWIYWSMGKEVVSSVRRMLNDELFEGVILLSNAGCGPDSFISELIEQTFFIGKKPFMNLVIDEHTSDAGLRTRIEAFLDMIERRKTEGILK